MAFLLASFTHINPETGAAETLANAYGVITELTLCHHVQEAQAEFAVYASAAARTAGARPIFGPVTVSWAGAGYESVFGVAPAAPPAGLTAPTTCEDVPLAQAYTALPAALALNPATASLLTGATAV